MKKTLIALAALAATTAFAQSSVTISGSLDVGINVNGAAKTTTLNQAGNGLNQIAFSGTEDLGGGLKANFLLQQRFNPTHGKNDGTNGGRATFQGASTVGLSGAFGNVRLGREIEAYNDVNNWADPWGTVRAASIAAAGHPSPASVNDGGEVGRSEGIHYNSPSFGGLTIGVTYGFEDRTAAQIAGGPAHTQAHTALNAVYSAGPLTLMGGMMQSRYGEDLSVIGAGYNFGVADVRVAMHNIDGKGALGANPADYKATQISANLPMGSTVLSAGYISTDTAGVKSNKMGLGAQYNLSKRTALIGTIGKTKATASNYDLSVKHTF